MEILIPDGVKCVSEIRDHRPCYLFAGKLITNYLRQAECLEISAKVELLKLVEENK